MWKKYTDLEPIRRLRYEGRELLGERVLLTEKRDGENVCLWLDENKGVRISSRRQEDAEQDIQSRMKSVPEYEKIVDLLNDEYRGNICVYGELLKGISPTRIEPRRKHIHWILFDVWDCDEERYMPYNWVYQLGYHYKIPVVRIVDDFIPMSEGELFAKIEESKAWCKRHRREGVVGKVHNSKEGIQIYFKEKIDLPKRPKIKQTQNRPEYPPMPEEKIIRALQHAYDEIGGENWKNTKIAMPIVARHISTEAKEHNYDIPKNMYSYYINTPLEIIVSTKQSEEVKE